MDQTTLAAQQDAQRTPRLFLAAISSAMGIDDQTYVGQDGSVVNYPRQYQTIGMNGAVGVEGASISNTQSKAIALSPGMLLLGAAVLYLILKK